MAGAETFQAVPLCREPAGLVARVAVLGVPLASPYRSLGTCCAQAPSVLRAAAAAFPGGRAQVNLDLGRPGPGDDAVADCGDLALDAADAAGNRVRIRHAVGGIVAAGAVPVVLGGDGSVVVPVLQGFEGHGPLTVLQLGARIDWREQVEGERWGLSSAMRRASEMGHVARIVQVGARGPGAEKAEDLAAARAFGAEIVPAERIVRDGIGPALEQIAPGARVHVALAAGVFDPAVMPAALWRAAGGLGYWDVLGLIRGVSERARIVGFSLVDVVPERDHHGIGAATAAQLVASVLGVIAEADAETDAAAG